MKTDNRHYNRKTQRNLKIEMDLFCLLKGKTIKTNCIVNGKPINGIIQDVIYISLPRFNFVRLVINDGGIYNIQCKYGKLIPSDQYKIY